MSLDMFERQVGARIDALMHGIDQRFDMLEVRQDRVEAMLREIQRQVNRWAGGLVVLSAAAGWAASWLKGAIAGH